MSAPTYGQMWPRYARQWDAMVVKRPDTVRAVAERIIRHKAKYQAVEKLTGVPWYWIGPAHIRESDGDFKTSLAQGDRWDRMSVHVPRGRGPFLSWEDAAFDALVTLKRMNQVQDWRLEKLIYWWELYNGWGYHNRGIPSPYVWGSTSIQKSGKYIADGLWSSTAWDSQLGCAAMLSEMMKLDPSIRPERETADDMIPKLPDGVRTPTKQPQMSPRTKSIGIGASIVAFVAVVAAWADAHPWLIVGAVAVAVAAVILAIRQMEK